jgi:retinol dehydrogenase 14
MRIVAEVEAMTDRTVLITGATSGIGFYTAKALVGLGAHVLVTGRDRKRGEAAADELRGAAGNAQVEFLGCDHALIAANAELGRHLRERLGRLDILINNVGALPAERTETPEGIEVAVATSFFGPFALTRELLPALQRSPAARIVNVVSSAQESFREDPTDDIHSTRSYVGFSAYARAKRLEVLWTFALARRFAESGVVANALNPGSAWTRMTREMPRSAMAGPGRLWWPLIRLVQRWGSREAAASACISVATSPELKTLNGEYIESDGRPARAPAATRDIALQERAWTLAESTAARILDEPLRSAS